MLGTARPVEPRPPSHVSIEILCVPLGVLVVTQEERIAKLAAVEAKLASGVRRVEQGDQGTEYQTTAQLLTAIAYLKREIAQAAGTAVHSRLAATRNGT